jgi:hypothetical protein
VCWGIKLAPIHQFWQWHRHFSIRIGAQFTDDPSSGKKRHTSKPSFGDGTNTVETNWGAFLEA